MSHQHCERGRSFMRLGKVVRQHMPPPRPELELPVLPSRADRLLGVFEATGASISEFDGEGRMTYASPNVESIIGFTPEECLASDCIEFHPDDLPSVVAIGRKVRLTGEPATNEGRVRHRQGHWVWIETTLLGWYDSIEGAFHTVSVTWDITERRRAERNAAI